MRFKAGTLKKSGSFILLAAMLTACNNSNFKSDPGSKVIRKAPASSADGDDGSTSPPATADSDVSDLPRKQTETEVSRLPDLLSQSFVSSLEKEGRFDFSLDVRDSRTSFTLADENSSRTDERSQITRIPANDSAVQGTLGSSQSEVLNQVNARGIVDILVVIDDSGSMVEEQNNLSTKMDSLLSSLTDTDWRVGVVTTSVLANDECNLSLIRSDVGTFEQQKAQFATAINAGLRGSGNEQGIRQAVNGLRCTGNPWLRSNSSVAVLIVSDEDNCSDGLGCPGSPSLSETFLTDFVEQNLGREVGKTAGFYGIFEKPGVECSTARTATIYQRLIDFKGAAGKGASGDICAADYSSTLLNISRNISELLESKFLLKQVPDSGSLVVRIQERDGTILSQTLGVDYTLVNNAITFVKGRAPAAASKILVSYRVGARPIVNTMTLSNVPAADTLKVTVNNVETKDFTLNGRIITFRVTPPADAQLAASYRRDDTKLFTRFAVNTAPIANSLNVKVNGSAVSNFTFDAAKNEILFQSAPVDGARVSISYNFRVGLQRTYALPLPQDAKNVKILDSANQEVPFTQQGNQLTIQAGNRVAGATLVLSALLPDASDRRFNLPQDPLDGTESLATNGSCTLDNGITLSAASLIANCAVEAKTDFVLTYKYLELQLAYTVQGVTNPEVGSYTVLVNGKPTVDYVRSGSTIVLNFDPGLDAKVDISYTFPE